jgi:carotenoid cleavage dioxygenase-like enzyme
METASFFFTLPESDFVHEFTAQQMKHVLHDMFILHSGMEQTIETYEDVHVVHLDPGRRAYSIVIDLTVNGIVLNGKKYKVTSLFPWNHPKNTSALSVYAKYLEQKSVDYTNKMLEQNLEQDSVPEPPRLQRSYGKHHTTVTYDPVNGLRMSNPNGPVIVGGPLDPWAHM